MNLTNLNRNTLESIMKKMNTMTLQKTASTCKSLKKQSQSEINKRKKAAIVIKKKYIASKRKKIKEILKTGINVMNEYGPEYPTKINNNLSNEFLIQYNISPREEMTILKELIQYLLESNFESGQMARNRHMNSRVNYVMKTSSKKSEDDLYEMLETYKRFYV